MVISADKPEDKLSVTVIDEERDIKVSTAAHGVVECIETQDRGIFTRFVIIMKLNHIAGDIRVADLRFAFTGFSRAGHKNTYRNCG